REGEAIATRAPLLPFRPPAARGAGGAVSFAVVALAAATGLLLWWQMAPATFAFGLAAMLVAGTVVAGVALLRTTRGDTIEAPRDWSLLHAALADGADATVITNRGGALVCASPAFETLFGGPV